MAPSQMRRMLTRSPDWETSQQTFEMVDEEKLPEGFGGYLPLRNTPRHDKEVMSRKAIFAQFCAYMLYKYEGRQLDRVEVAVMMKRKFYPNYGLRHTLFERFEKPTDQVTVACQMLDDKTKQAWLSVIDEWFKELLSDDPVAFARAENLSGL